MTTGQDSALARAAAAHRIVIFEDRLIFEARPPITSAQLADVEARIGGKVPPGLLALWRTAFGGSIAYALDVAFGDEVAQFSFAEIFYPGSDGYRDLPGWIGHEFDTAVEAGDADAARGVLRFLPFGGFEYGDRLYVCLEEGADYGAVFAWMQGLPPAWSLRLNRDSVARVADDVPALFRQLGLRSDPFAEGEEDFSEGSEMAEAIAGVRETDPALADALAAKARAALLDWRAALAAGSLAGDARLRRIALAEAAKAGDLALAEQLAAQGCDLDERYSGGGNLLDHILAGGHDAAGAALIERGVDPRNAILAAAHSLSAERVEQLLVLGAAVSDVAARTAALAGLTESAKRIADAIAARDRAMLAAMPADLEYSAAREEMSANRVESGAMGSNMTPAQYRTQAADLRLLKHHVEELIGRRPWLRRLFDR